MAEIIFEFDVDFPDSVRGAVEPLLKDAAWLFPLWMQKVILTWDTNQDGAQAKILVYKDYRWCRIVIYPDLLSVPDDTRKESIYHEIIHCYNVPLKQVACEILEECMPDEKGEFSEKLQNVLRKRIDRTMEAITQDLTYAILNKFNERA
jgi:hypothetical protein